MSERASLRAAPPSELIDPDGEGVYLYEDQGSVGVLMRAARLFFNDARRWHDIESRTVFMRPDEDGDSWHEVGIGRFPFGWKFNLPRRWRPVRYVYCAPKADAL